MRPLQVAFAAVVAAASLWSCSGSSNHLPDAGLSSMDANSRSSSTSVRAAAAPNPGATNVLQNPGFETGSFSPWTTVGSGPGMAMVVSTKAHSGTYSAFMGTTKPPAVNGLYGISQTVVIPTNGLLSFWYQGASNDQIKYGDDEVDLTDATGKIVDQCFKALVNSTVWTQASCDVSAYAGQTLNVVAGVRDNGYSKTYVYWYVDDFVLASGSPPTATPSPSPTATASSSPGPIPPGGLIRNDSFEHGKAPWFDIGTGYGSATITKAKAHSGQYSALTGTTSDPAINGFHGIAQTIVIPDHGQLSMWVYGGSTDTFAYSQQTAQLVDRNGSVVYQCFRALENDTNWVEKDCYVGRFAGQTLTLQIGVTDNGYSGTHTFLYVDDVTLYGGKIPFPTPEPSPTAGPPSPSPAPTLPASGPIKHVVIVLQENRTFNNVFHGYPGANTTSIGYNIDGKPVALHQTRFMTPYDPGHQYQNWLTEYNAGLMDGFSDEGVDAGKAPSRDFAYAYAQQSDVQPYWDLAAEGVLADAFFADHRSQSYAGHLFPIAGASGPISADLPQYYVSENPSSGGGCDNIGSGTAINILTGAEDKQYQTCFNFKTIADLLTQKGKTWRYYVDASSRSSIVNGFDSIKHIRNSETYADDVVSPAARVVKDGLDGNLASVSYVIGSFANSDHAGQNVPSSNGPTWVSSVVNAIGEGKAWNSTVVFFTYDDWGGWYDALPPPTTFNQFGPGFRLPFVAISPYARRGSVDHNVHYIGSMLHYIERTFDLGSLGTTDAKSDDLGSMFDYRQQPLPYVPVKSAQTLQQILAAPNQGPPKGMDPD